MIEVTLILLVSLIIAVFIKPSWLSWIVSTVGMFIIFGATAISIVSSGLHDLTPMYLWVGAWFWGMVIAAAIKLIWIGASQVTFKATNQWPWLNWLMCAFWLAFAAGSIGYAFASNIAISYAANYEAASILYARSMAGAASGFFFLSLAAHSALVAFIKPALTSKGLRIGVAALLGWRDVESYEWQGNRLIIHKKTKFSHRWLSKTWVAVNPPDLEIVNRILVQHLPDRQLQLPYPIQATA